MVQRGEWILIYFENQIFIKGEYYKMEAAIEKDLTLRLKDEMATKVKSMRALGRPEEQKNIGMGVPYREGVKLCIERARLVTQAYKEHEGEPIVIVRARALEKILDNMTIYLEPEDRIAGNYASDPDSLTMYPEQYFIRLKNSNASSTI